MPKAMAPKKQITTAKTLSKSLTGIIGLDGITQGGLPTGRSTLVVGGAGCGKSLFCMQFLMNGALQLNEPGLFVSFEETETDLIKNTETLNYDLKSLVRKKKIVLDHVHISRSEFEESGEYNLDGLFIRISYAIDRYKIKRVVFDTIEVLFGHLMNEAVIRSELQRLFSWLKEKNVTGIVTAEQGQYTMTRYGLEEYVADCVIFLDFRVVDQIATRRLRVVKYRGSTHGSNEYPFIIDSNGISVVPVTSITLDYPVSTMYVSSGVKSLDGMLNGKGYFKGSSVLISGLAGVGKTSFAAAFVDYHCKTGKKCVYIAFEESAPQIIRNLRSIGIDLGPWHKKKQLFFHTVRPNIYGLETHLMVLFNIIDAFGPEAVVIDPISNLRTVGSPLDVKLLLSRMINFLKQRQITSVMTSLLTQDKNISTLEGISSLMDTWLLLKYMETNGERNRVLMILKSRGMPHSRQMQEIIFSKQGITLQNVYIGLNKVLTGTARVMQAIQSDVAALERRQEFAHKQTELENKKHLIETEIENLHHTLETILQEKKELERSKADVKHLVSAGKKAISGLNTLSGNGKRPHGRIEK